MNKNYRKLLLSFLGCAAIGLAALPAFAQQSQNQDANDGAETTYDEEGFASPQMPPVAIEGNPSLEEVMSEVQVSPEERQRQLEEQARDLAFDAAINGLLPLKPGEIRRLLETYDESTTAAQTPLLDAPKPEVTVQTVSLDPGVQPPVIKLAPGHVTTLSMLDQTGAPWPILDVSWGGDFDVLQPEGGGNVIRISPLGAFKRGNMSIRLTELSTPITFMLETHRDVVQYRFDARIPKYGPDAVIPIIERGGLNTLAAGNTDLVSVLDGTPPGGAERMTVEGVDGRTSAYKMGELVYIRTPFTLLSPAWSNSVASADGLNVYTIDDTPVILLSDGGKMVRATIREAEEEL